MKTSILLSLMAVGMVAAANPVDCSVSLWELNPIAWTFDAKVGSMRAKGLGDLVALKAERSAKVTVSALVRPESSGTAGYPRAIEPMPIKPSGRPNFLISSLPSSVSNISRSRLIQHEPRPIEYAATIMLPRTSDPSQMLNDTLSVGDANTNTIVGAP